MTSFFSHYAFFGGSPLLQQPRISWHRSSRITHFSVGALCFRRRSWTSVQRRSIGKNRGFSHGHFEGPALKRERNFPPKFRSAQALLPRMNAGAPTWARAARKNATEALSSHYTTASGNL